eukprot:CAMPEP_0119322348 /NCGR_PEP_ID=MMETSP1333-20130426/57916_1 /TAXON_ID=418940 /ORGANISM="Scyphosphaera apsteinii, Strain RCC1455" /LENGTH=153 /DNA_ID=CAMNT_0007329547 /DNA_START=171 /DNA_END=632 /DNA_ORIENTATION=+
MEFLDTAFKEKLSSAQIELIRVREAGTKQVIQAAMTGADQVTMAASGVKKAAEFALQGIDEIDQLGLDSKVVALTRCFAEAKRATDVSACLKSYCGGNGACLSAFLDQQGTPTGADQEEGLHLVRPAPLNSNQKSNNRAINLFGGGGLFRRRI